MKQWHIITISILVLGLLAFNAIRMRVTRSHKDRESYVSSLNFRISGRVDSISFIHGNDVVGYIIFQTKDSINRNTEDSLNWKRKLKGRTRFIRFRPRGKFAIFSPGAGNAEVGDSLYIDSDADRFYLFRKGRKVIESVISENLGGPS